MMEQISSQIHNPLDTIQGGGAGSVSSSIQIQFTPKIVVERVDSRAERTAVSNSSEPPRPVQPIVSNPPYTLTAEDSLYFNLNSDKTEIVLDWCRTHEVEPDPFQCDQLNRTEQFWTLLKSFEKESVAEDTTIVSEKENIESNQTYLAQPDSQHELDAHQGDSFLQSDGLVALVFFGVALLGLIRMVWGRYLNDLLQFIIYPSYVARLSSNNASNFFPSLLLGFLFYYNSTLFIFQIATIYNHAVFGFTGWFALGFIFAMLFLLLTAKIIVYRIVGHVFDTSKETHFYLSGSSLTVKAFGVLITPVVLFLPYVEPSVQPYLVRFGLGLFILFYLLQVARGFKINFTNLLSAYYLFLYLCALEILPLTILYKVLFK